MKALSIKGHWAEMILSGKKTIETRTWKTNHRGKILLCASKDPETKLSGCAFAIAEIDNCLPMVKDDEKFACCEIYDNAWSWFLINVTPIKKFRVKGMLGLFEVPLVNFILKPSLLRNWIILRETKKCYVIAKRKPEKHERDYDVGAYHLSKSIVVEVVKQ